VVEQERQRERERESERARDAQTHTQRHTPTHTHVYICIHVHTHMHTHTHQSVDRAWEAMKDSPEAIPDSVKTPFLTQEVARELAQVFARGQDAEYGGLTPGFLEGSQHQMLVRGRSPRHRGVLIGVLQCVGVCDMLCYTVLQCVARSVAVVRGRSPGHRGSLMCDGSLFVNDSGLCCSVLQCVKRCVAVCEYNVLQCVAVCCSVLQCVR